MAININLHTVVMAVGPSGAGKSHFFKNKFIPDVTNKLKEKYPAWKKPNVQYISSDEIRKLLLGYEAHKHNPAMLTASASAFNLLFAMLKEMTSYPINADVIVVDTTGLSESFRSKVVEIASANQYKTDLMIFDYKKSDEYLKYLDEDHNKRIIFDHIERLRKDVYATLNSKKYNNIHKIKNKNFEECEIVLTDLDEYLSHLLPLDFRYEFIGDVHGCYDTLVKLLQERGFTVDENRIQGREDTKIVFVGDLIDKGPHSKKVMKLVLNNLDRVYVVRGNHENFVHKYFSGDIKPSSYPKEEIIKEYFTTVDEFKNDPEAKKDLKTLFEIGKDFYLHPHFTVTHAPCENKYLGKLDSYSLKKQRNFSYPRSKEFSDFKTFSEAADASLRFLEKESEKYHPYHVFGHVAVQRPIRVKNKFGIDTGCVQGGHLTALSFNGSRPTLISVPLLEHIENKEQLPILLSKKEEKFSEKHIDFSTLDPVDFRRLRWLCTNKINFISGTMSPSNKDDITLETIRNALQYYKQSGVNDIVIQPKWMGSRCQIYLHKDLAKCKSVSRNGYLIRQVDLTDVYKQLQVKYASLFDTYNAEQLILDGELLPWRVLGKGLIEDTFNVVNKGIQTEIDLLQQTNFEKHLSELLDKLNQSDFEKECTTLSKSKLVEKYSHPVYETFTNMKGFNWIPLAIQKELHKNFERQIDVFGVSCDLYFEAFSILKIIHTDGTESFCKNSEFLNDNFQMFESLNPGLSFCLNLDDFDTAVGKAESFYDSIISTEMEGVVIKPKTVYIEKIAPALKVRSGNYLSIVYGYDYTAPHKLKKLLRQKNINKKLQLSINEWEIGLKMLEISDRDISLENPKYVNLALLLISEKKNEEHIDPRL